MLYEIGRRTQAAALMMRKHTMLPSQQLCECGRIPTRVIPAFGLRCDIACDHWDVARATMARFLVQAVSNASREHRAPSGWRGCAGSTKINRQVPLDRAPTSQCASTTRPRALLAGSDLRLRYQLAVAPRLSQ